MEVKLGAGRKMAGATRGAAVKGEGWEGGGGRPTAWQFRNNSEYKSISWNNGEYESKRVVVRKVGSCSDLQVHSQPWRQARAAAEKGDIATLRLMTINVQMAPKDGKARSLADSPSLVSASILTSAFSACPILATLARRLVLRSTSLPSCDPKL